MRFVIVLLSLPCLLLLGCEELEDLTDTGMRDTDVTTATGAADTADTSTTPLTATVTMTAMIRSVTANGQVFVEGNFTWNASGQAGLRVDIQVKNSVAYPDWTSLLSNQDPVDVGTAEIRGPDQMWNFRAIAYLPGDPTNFVSSPIDTIP